MQKLDWHAHVTSFDLMHVLPFSKLDDISFLELLGSSENHLTNQYLNNINVQFDLTTEDRYLSNLCGDHNSTDLHCAYDNRNANCCKIVDIDEVISV